MIRLTRSVFPIAAAAVLLIWISGSAPAVGTNGTPGTISVSSTEISGQAGKVLLVFAGSEGGPAGRLCAFVGTSDPFVLDPTVITEFPADGDPCGDPTDGVVFPAGDYTFEAGIYTGGSQTPEVQVQMQVTVDGNVEVQIDGSALSAPLFGDVNCNGVVDALDALAILRFAGDLPQNPPAGCPEIGS